MRKRTVELPKMKSFSLDFTSEAAMHGCTPLNSESSSVPIVPQKYFPTVNVGPHE
jgi:hypothetical protein